MSGPEDEKFLARWSRRKRAARAPDPGSAEMAAPPSPCPSPAQAREREPYGAGERSEPGEGGAAPSTHEAGEHLPELKLPDIATLTAGSDIRAFMQPGVPQALRRAALSRVWSLDPAIRDFREMADYDWDFNVAGGAPGYGPLEASAEQIEHWVSRILPPQATEPPDSPPAAAASPARPAVPPSLPHSPADEAPALPAGPAEDAPLPGVAVRPSAPPALPDSPPGDGAGPVPGDRADAPRARRHGSAVPV